MLTRSGDGDGDGEGSERALCYDRASNEGEILGAVRGFEDEFAVSDRKVETISSSKPAVLDPTWKSIQL